MREISDIMALPSGPKGERIISEDLSEDFNPVTETQKQPKPSIQALKPVDHSKIAYDPILRVFFTQAGYKEHPAVNSMSDTKIQEFVTKHEVHLSGGEGIKPVFDFYHLPVDLGTIDKLIQIGINKPTPIQSWALPAALSGKDVIGVSQTASGKTLAFALPVGLSSKNQGKSQKGEGPTSLILVPTRELCLQVFKELKKILYSFKLRIVSLYGGVPKSTQWKELKSGCEVIVATPARLIDLVQSKACSLKNVNLLVLDEADLLFSMGFEYQVRSIISQIRPDRQTLFFSATFRQKLSNFVQDVLSDPVSITIGSSVHCNPQVRQEIIVLDHPSKKLTFILENLQKFLQDGQVLIFVKNKVATEELFSMLKETGIPCALLNGDMDQMSRESVFSSFVAGDFKVLVATDIASRGLNVLNIYTVINFDCAKDVETHVHRIGRTGRVDYGRAISLLTKSDKKFAGDLLLNLEYNDQVVPDKLEKLAMEDTLFRIQRMKNDRNKIRHCKTANPETANLILGKISRQKVNLDLEKSADELRQEIFGKKKEYFQEDFKQKFVSAGKLNEGVEKTTVSYLEKPRKKSKWDMQ